MTYTQEDFQEWIFQIEFKMDFSGLIIFYGCLIVVVTFLSIVCYKDRRHNIENTLSEWIYVI